MDVREFDDAIEFVADVPGARDEDLQVEVLKKDPNAHRAFDVLVVRGERDSLVDDARFSKEDDSKEKKTEEKKKPPAGGTFRVRERHFGAFENRYALPQSVDVDRVSAKPSKGVLTVTAPKRRNAGPDAVPAEPAEPPKREVRRVAVAAE
jgi:HSP20 family protein